MIALTLTEIKERWNDKYIDSEGKDKSFEMQVKFLKEYSLPEEFFYSNWTEFTEHYIDLICQYQNVKLQFVKDKWDTLTPLQKELFLKYNTNLDRDFIKGLIDKGGLNAKQKAFIEQYFKELINN